MLLMPTPPRREQEQTFYSRLVLFTGGYCSEKAVLAFISAAKIAKSDQSSKEKPKFFGHGIEKNIAKMTVFMQLILLLHTHSMHLK